MDFHRTNYRFWPVNDLASRTKDARSIYSNRELKNTWIFNESSIKLFSLWFTFTKITAENDSILLLEGFLTAKGQVEGYFLEVFRRLLDRKRSSSHADSVDGHVTHYHLACHVQPYILNPLVFQTFLFKQP